LAPAGRKASDTRRGEAHRGKQLARLERPIAKPAKKTEVRPFFKKIGNLLTRTDRCNKKPSISTVCRFQSQRSCISFQRLRQFLAETRAL
jgi:hypothetical protein